MLAIPSQTIHTPTAETDGLSIDVPAAFKVANQSHSENVNLVEIIRPPETLETWSQLISVATVMHASESTTLSQFYPLWRDGYRDTCPGPNETVVRGTVDGKPALKATLFCPRDPKTGTPESLTIIFVQGDVNIMTVQLAFRRATTSPDNALIQKILKSMKICDARDQIICAARRASGFLPYG